MAARLTVHVYCSAAGRSPVLEWLAGLREPHLDECVALIESLAEQGSGLRMPASRPLGGGLYELRGRVGRVQLRLLYFFQPGSIAVVAAGFVKQGPSVLDRERRLAQVRRHEVEADPVRHTTEVAWKELGPGHRRKNQP